MNEQTSRDRDTARALYDASLRSKIDRSLRHPVMFFFTSGAAWLALGIFFGLLRAYKRVSPSFLEDCALFTTGRIDMAHSNVLLYGWACQAAFGAIIWLMARLSRREGTQAGLVLAAGHLWNVAVMLGVGAILLGKGEGVSWLEFPRFVWPVLLLSYGLITIWSVIQFRVREKEYVYVSQWFILGALFWFPWVFLTANVCLHWFEGHPLMVSAVGSWYKGTVMLLFLAPISIGAAYYFIPKVTGKPVHSYHLALLAFWVLAIVGPWSGMQKVVGIPLITGLPYLAGTATALFALPALLVGANLMWSLFGSGDRVDRSPTLRFTTAGMVGLVLFGLAGLFLNLPGLMERVQFSMSWYGYEILGLYGMFSFCMFGAIYFIVPRITCREWLSKRFITLHFWLSVYGIVVVVLFGIIGGIFEGSLQNRAYEFSSWEGMAARGLFYNTGIALAWAFILCSNVFFFLHLLLMWMRLGRRSSHPTLIGHEEAHKEMDYELSGPHGPEGDIDLVDAKAGLS